MSKILSLFGKRKPVTIESITRPMADIAAKLQAYSADQAAQSEAKTEAARLLREEALAQSSEAAKAQYLSERYKHLSL